MESLAALHELTDLLEAEAAGRPVENARVCMLVTLLLRRFPDSIPATLSSILARRAANEGLP